jgi:hypothetical protein
MGILIMPTPEPIDAASDGRGTLHIREVVRVTGLRREQLYMWQRRYGLPSPARDANGDRVYPAEQVARLKLIKELLSEGWRAGAVVPLAEAALRSMLGLVTVAPAGLPGDIDLGVDLLARHRIGELSSHLSRLLMEQGLRPFLEHTLMPLSEAVSDKVVRGEMQSFQQLRFGDLAQRLLREVTRLVRPSRNSRQILLATPPNDPNQLGLAMLELLLFTDGMNCVTLGAGVPVQEIAGAATAYEASLVVLLFERGISGKVAGQEIRALRRMLPPSMPLVCCGRAVNLLAKPIVGVHTVAASREVVAAIGELGVLPRAAGARTDVPAADAGAA